MRPRVSLSHLYRDNYAMVRLIESFHGTGFHSDLHLIAKNEIRLLYHSARNCERNVPAW